MTTVKVTKSINVPAEKVWAMVSTFRGIENYSPIERSVVTGEGEGAKRSCFMPDGAEIKEVLSKVDASNMQLQYIITEGPFPITDYLSTVTVKDNGTGAAEVTWASEYNVVPEAAKEISDLFHGFYNVIIDSLETLINNQN